MKQEKGNKGGIMKKTIITILLGILLIGAFGAIVVSAVSPNDTGKGYCSGPMNRWASRYTGSGEGNYASCPYYTADGTVEFKVKTLDEAFEIAKDEIDKDVSKDDIYQMNRWWIVFYEDDNGTSTRARIDAVTGEVYAGYDTPAWCQAGSGCGRGSGYSRGAGHCMGYGR